MGYSLFRYLKNMTEYTKKIPILTISRCQNKCLKNNTSILIIILIKTTMEQIILIVGLTIFNPLPKYPYPIQSYIDIVLKFRLNLVITNNKITLN
jgi:hypothetical protein